MHGYISGRPSPGAADRFALHYYDDPDLRGVSRPLSGET